MRKKRKETCGIYSITNTVNNKIYIGQSMKIENRIKNHFDSLKTGKHKNERLQADFNEYGATTFKTEIIKECDSLELDREESILIYTLDALNEEKGYNIMKVLDYRDYEGEKLDKIINHFVNDFLHPFIKRNKEALKTKCMSLNVQRMSEEIAFTAHDIRIIVKEITLDHFKRIEGFIDFDYAYTNSTYVKIGTYEYLRDREEKGYFNYRTYGLND